MLFQYDGDGRRPRPHRADRLQGRLDARRAAAAAPTGHRGGYTYADYGKIIGAPEVHGDGEIWAQTLWDLRRPLGSTVTEIAGHPGDGALAVQPVVPRRAQRDPAGRHRGRTAAATTTAIWKVFAHRGMGYFAGSLGGDDTHTRRRLPPPPTSTPRRHRSRGTVTDADTGQPASGAHRLAGLPGRARRRQPLRHDRRDGRYSHRSGAGRDLPEAQRLRRRLRPGARPRDGDHGRRREELHGPPGLGGRSGGGTIIDFNGPDFGPGCGPVAGDRHQPGQRLGHAPPATTTATRRTCSCPKYIVIKLPASDRRHRSSPSTRQRRAVTDGSASTGDYRIETSPNGTTWTPAASGTFTVDDRGGSTRCALRRARRGELRAVHHARQPDAGFATNCPDGASRAAPSPT